MSRPGSRGPRLAGWAASLVAVACSHPQEGPSEPGIEYLLDHPERLQMESELLTAMQAPQQVLEVGLQELVASGPALYALPVPVARNRSGRPLLLELEGSASTRLIPAVQEVVFEDLAVFQESRHRKMPDGRRAVLVRESIDFTVTFEGVGVPCEVEIIAGVLGSWLDRMPAVEVWFEDQRVASYRPRHDAIEIHRTNLPARTGPQSLQVLVGDVSADPRAPQLVLRGLLIRASDGRERLQADGEDRDRTLRYAPDFLPVRVLDAEMSGRLAFIGKGWVGIQGPAGASLRWDGQQLPPSVVASELAFLSDLGSVHRFEFDAGPDSRSFLLQPAALAHEELSFLRGDHDRRQPLIRYVMRAGDTRQAVLAPPPTRIRRPLDGDSPRVLEFSWSASSLSPAPATPSLAIRFQAEDGEPRELWRQEVTPAFTDGAWHSVAVPIPSGPGELHIDSEVDPAQPVASRLHLITVASPRLRPTRDPDIPPRNLVIYLMDTVRADHLSCYGYDRETSPNLDALAREGFLFETAVASAPWTRPSVATMFTGLLYSSHGAGKEHGLPPGLVTLAEHFQRAGMATAAIVANAQIHSAGLHFEQGFRRMVALEAETGATDADAIHDHAVRWLDENGGAPFFLYLHSIDAHSPYAPPESTRGTFSEGYAGSLRPASAIPQSLRGIAPLSPEDLQFVNDLYDEEILFNDRQFGRLVEELRRRGIYANTTLVVVSDHGEEFYDHQDFGHGGRLYQELTRVPWILKPEGPPRPGQRIRAPVRMLDLLPTLLDLFGLPLGDEPCQGTSLVPLLRGAELPPLDLLAEEEPEMQSLQRGPWKVIRRLRPQTGRETLEYFDLAADPAESVNLAKVRPAEAGALAEELELMIEQFRAMVAIQPSATEVTFSAEEREALRVLGYLDDDS